MAAEPENPQHRLHTVRRLLGLLTEAVAIEPGFPESPHPGFRAHLDTFTAAPVPHL